MELSLSAWLKLMRDNAACSRSLATLVAAEAARGLVSEHKTLA